MASCRDILIALVGSLSVLACAPVLCQSGDSETAPSQVPAKPTTAGWNDNHEVSIGVKVSTLGVGADVAARVVPHAGVRAGFNVLGYSRTFTKDGIPYDAHLDFRTVEGHFDYFPRAGNFYISLGVIGVLGDPVTAHASIAGGQSFTLGGTTYYSDTVSPTHGNGRINFNAAAPVVTFGWANLLRHNKGPFSIPLELGVALQGSPQTTLNLAGNACLAAGVDCVNVATDPSIQANVLSEQNKINSSVSFFKVYPLISLGLSYRF